MDVSTTSVSSIPEHSGDDDSRSPWEVFGVCVRRWRTKAGVVPEDVDFPEVCTPRNVRELEEGSDPEPSRFRVGYLDRRFNAQGRLLDAWARAYITTALESDTPEDTLRRGCDQVREFQPMMIPEAFQTRAYSDALAHASHLPRAHLWASEVQRAWSGTWHSSTTSFDLVLNEQVIRSITGSTATTLEQLKRLRQAATKPYVSLQILPHSTHEHPCRNGGAFRLLDFSTHHRLAYLPAPDNHGHLVTEAQRIRDLSDLFETLKGEALTPTDSLHLLDITITTLDHEHQIEKEGENHGTIAELPRPTRRTPAANTR